MEKVFSLDKFVEDSIRRGICKTNIVASIDNWGIKCMGKTKQQLDKEDYLVHNDWMIEKDIREEFKVSEGDLFYLDTEPYILARTDVDTFCLISLNNGNRWEEPVHLEDLDIPRDMFEELFINNEYKVWYQVPRKDCDIRIIVDE